MVDGREGAARPEDITRLFAERAKAKDAEGLAALYEDDAVLAFPPGQMTQGEQRSVRCTRNARAGSSSSRRHRCRR